MGLFITFEGIEGSGKTTQIQRLKGYVEERGYRCRITREPGGCRVGERIRDILMDADNETLTPLSELLLIMANRAQHIIEVIEPTLSHQGVLICDRFHDATVAYQGYGRGMALDLIERLNRAVTKGIKPDLTILLDCPVEVGLKRAEGRMAAMDRTRREGRFEAERRDFHQKVRDGYLAIAQADRRRVRVVNGSRDVGAVERAIRRIVDPLLR